MANAVAGYKYLQIQQVYDYIPDIVATTCICVGRPTKASEFSDRSAIRA
ncbi:MAG: hypothetical protein Q8L19_11490 [Reyranella sp.]|nr:hypothetical protein [Reyranella sp.]